MIISQYKMELELT